MEALRGEGTRLLAEVLEVSELEGREARALAGVGLAVIETGERPFLCGSFSSLTVAELMGLASSTLKTCRISFRTGEAKKTLWLRDGQLVWAGSSEVEDRLGPALLREGMVTPEDLLRLESKVQTGRKLGRVLVEEEVLSPPDVYLAIGHQVRHIALSLFDAVEGSFALVEDSSDLPAEVKVPQRTRDLVLEGLRRPEFMAAAAAAVPDMSLVVTGVLPPPADPGPKERNVLRAVDGKRTAGQVIEASGVGKASGLLALGALVKAGLVKVAARARPAHPKLAEIVLDEEAAPTSRGPFDIYRSCLQHAWEALQRHGGGGNLELYLLDPRSAPGDLFEGLTFEGGGELDVDRLLANATQSGPSAHGRARALEALERLLSCALFEIRDLLPPGEAATTLSEIQAIQSGKR